MSIITKLFEKIGKSLDGGNNKVSSIRIQGYVMLSLVALSTLAFIFIECWNAAMSWKLNKPYAPSNEMIIAFGMILSHHIAIMFNRNKPPVTPELTPKEPVAETNNNTSQNIPASPEASIMPPELPSMPPI